ncbi:DOMON-like domain-containing protein [Sphingosinicella sp. LHD-64]|uniref:DOMON-like domain-containing protein n=1 Tax=Sphingosinicella sp. LHD-64 TaxID=3072139 RepID=UPI00280C7B4E|nr:DOMON-like domain-containing protein [Sphingosinicella sp. LHD-64]MDQ8755628.1 DOMON-like domain-containing protein [Sphingosinicella sp. LHD-64]
MTGKSTPGGFMCLRPFPDLPHPDIEVIAEASRLRADVLQLWLTLRGDLSGIVIPEFSEPARADDLWQHTCSEAFLLAGSGSGYCEFNISPSRHWAAYSFTRYREGRENLDIEAPDVTVAEMGSNFSIGAVLKLGPSLADKPWMLGLSAVIEEADGTKSYWALKHPPGKPDFHHPDCFALELPVI